MEQQELTALIADIVREKLQTDQAHDFTGRPIATKPVLTLKTAKMLLTYGEEKAASIGVPMVITLVDDGGNIKAQHRMDNSLLASIAISAEKAYAALALRASTEEAAKTILPGQPLYGLQDTHPGKFCLFGGGVPLFFQGTCIGAVGVSGGTVEQDVSVAECIREKAEKSGIR